MDSSPSRNPNLLKQCIFTLRPTTCLICARPASGLHYNVASCKGCKTFFRRMCTLPSEKSKIKCLIGNNQCFTRDPMVLRCRACRYQKGIRVGMNPTALELKEEGSKAPNYQKVRWRNLQLESELTAAQIPQNQVIRTLESAEIKMRKTVEMLDCLESKLETFRHSAYNPQWPDIENLELLLKINGKIGMAENMGPMPDWPINTEQLYFQQDQNLDDDSFWEQFDKCIPESKSNATMWIFYDLMTAVEYAKTFEFFHKLDMADRLILMRHVAVVVMNLHNSYFTVVSKYDRLISPDGSRFPLTDGRFGRAWNLAVAPLIRYQLTRVEYTLLKGICLCNPAVTGLSLGAQRLLSTQRELHASALFDHCKRTRKDGVNRFVEMLGLVGLLERQQKMQKDLHVIYVAPHVAKYPESVQKPLINDILNC